MKLLKANDDLIHRKFKEILSNICKDTAEVMYIDLGVKVVRLESYAPGLKDILRKQITWSLRDDSSHYDVTLVIWLDKDPMRNVQEDFKLFNTRMETVLEINSWSKSLTGYDAISKTYYKSFPYDHLEPEEFIKLGHALVNEFYRILKTSTSNLVHGACVGLDGKGVLFCARGQKGKSTLTVLALLKGFEYVSDDYLVLSEEEGGLYAYPIYSIISLSPTMYNELYDELEGTRFVCNNARGDKYILNISNFHDRFRTRYPVNVCMMLEFTSEPEPSIGRCTDAEKGAAINQLAHSTMMQMGDLQDPATSRKMIAMVRDKAFYRLRLCRDISKNVRFLKDFINNTEFS